jgi:Tfp pilus assembly protein PilN
VKAVNLIPTDVRRGGGGGSSFASQAPTYLILGVLAVALALVTVYVLTSNSIADRTAKLTSLQTQLDQTQAQAQTLVNHTQFAQLVQERTQSVRDIASTRFAWYPPLSDLSKVVPANTSLQSLNASLGSTSTTGGTGTSASGGGSLIGSATGPAIELTGCTRTQDDVARLMSRLRLIDGVTGVTLASSQKPGQNSSAVSSGSAGAVGCGSNAPTFDLMVALTPVPGSASATGAAAGTGSGTATTPTTGTSTTPATTTTATTPGATTPGATTAAPGATTTTPGATSTTPATTTTAGSTQ